MKKKLYQILHNVVNEGFFIQMNEKFSFVASKSPSIFMGLEATIQKVVVYTPHFFMTRLDSQEMFAIQLLNNDIIEALHFGAYFRDLKIEWNESSFESFKDDFQLIQEKINEGEIEKAVPSTFESSNWIPNAQDRLNMIHNLLVNSSNQKVYGYFTKQFGLIGLTPEILFSRIGSQVNTMALAGTQIKSEPGLSSSSALISSLAPSPSLLEDQKELLEHQLVIDKIKNTMKTF